LAGRALFNQGRSEEAAAAHRRAVALLPEASPRWRAAQWHLGLALAGTGNQASALAAYIKSYDPRAPDPARFALIESLYRKINGSIAGLDRALLAPAAAAAPPASFERASGTPATTPAQTESTAAATDAKKSGEAATPGSEAETKKAAAEGVAPAAIPTPEPSPAATPSPTAEPQSSPATPETKTPATPDPASPAADAKSPSASPGKRRRAGASSSPCTLAVETESLSLVGGASGSIVIRLGGGGDLARATATTPNWSDIIVLREPTAAAEPDTARFTVTSISKTAGTYVVNVKSPCGAKDVAVTVK
jgi:hypothetical protein